MKESFKGSNAKAAKGNRKMISIYLSHEVAEKVDSIAKKENRSRAAQCAFFIERGVLPPSLRGEKVKSLEDVFI